MFDFSRFVPGARVLDVGCGSGRELDQLRGRGCRPFGIDVDPGSVAACRLRDLPVLRSRAEELPFRPAAFDGAVCQVVLPLVDEQRTLQELSRVLKPGAVLYLSSHGPGYYYGRLFGDRSLGTRVYALRALLNSWCLGVLGLRLPGFLGDTACQSPARLRSVAEALAFDVLEERAEGHCLGQPAFLYYVLERRSRTETT